MDLNSYSKALVWVTIRHYDVFQFPVPAILLLLCNFIFEKMSHFHSNVCLLTLWDSSSVVTPNGNLHWQNNSWVTWVFRHFNHEDADKHKPVLHQGRTNVDSNGGRSICAQFWCLILNVSQGLYHGISCLGGGSHWHLSSIPVIQYPVYSATAPCCKKHWHSHATHPSQNISQ